MKRADLVFAALLVPLDYLALLAAATAAFSLRFAPFFVAYRPVTFNLSYSEYLTTVIPIASIYIIVFALSSLYSLRPYRIANEVIRIVVASSASIAVVLAIAFFSRELFDSRFIVLAAWALSILFLVSERVVVRLLQRTLRTLGVGVMKVAIIGKTKTANELLRFFTENPYLGYQPVFQAAHFGDETAKRLRHLKNNDQLDLILLANTDAERSETVAVKTFADVEHTAFFYAADLFPGSTLRPVTHTFAGRPVIEVPKTPLDGWGAIYKRGFDIIFSLLALIITLPIVLLSGLIILIEDGWPFIFINERIGARGKTFRLYKLRSMFKAYSIGPQFNDGEKNLALEAKLIKERSERNGPIYKIQNDPRITRIGRFIRTTSIDEFPQFWNVLKGDMSLVGPRPHQPREVDNYKPSQRRVLTIKPGITGLSQISGRANLDFDDEVRLDMYYIENWSPWLDLVILLKTPLAVIFRKGAY